VKPPASMPSDRPEQTLPGRCLGVLMPVFNERATIAAILGRVLAQQAVAEVVVVDDASTDGTADLLAGLAAQEDRIRVFRHETNRGKGAALRTAIGELRAPVAIIQDADLEYDPADFPALLQPILDGRADAVFGSRFIGGQAHRVLYFWHMVGNKFLTLLSNMFTNLNLSDMECCYKAFLSRHLREFHLAENGFGIEPELAAKASRHGLRIYEVGVSYAGRTYAEGKKITWRDGLQAIRTIATS
jgi:glycosyltransferase involved in cell wall biosynthesis